MSERWKSRQASKRWGARASSTSKLSKSAGRRMNNNTAGLRSVGEDTVSGHQPRGGITRREYVEECGAERRRNVDTQIRESRRESSR